MKSKKIRNPKTRSILVRLDEETREDLRRLSNELTGIEDNKVTMKEVARRMKNIDGVREVLRKDAEHKRRIRR